MMDDLSGYLSSYNRQIQLEINSNKEQLQIMPTDNMKSIYTSKHKSIEKMFLKWQHKNVIYTSFKERLFLKFLCWMFV